MQLTSSSPSGSEVSRHYPVNILLVDDRPENLLALEAILEPLGENLVLAASGQDALSQSLRQEFALVLLDVSMPDMDGFETARRIKGRRKSAATPIIFLTANSPDDRLILRGYEAGAADYLLKPLTPDVVRSKVAVFADLYRSRENARTSAAEVARAQAAALEAQEGQKRLSAVLTARKQAEAERDLALHQAVEAREAAEHAQEDAETANRGKSEFLATMSHEFRTPLNAILGYTQLLNMGVLGDVTPEQHDHLQRLRASGVHLLGLVNDILDLSKIEGGRVQVSRETGLVSEVVRGAKALVGPLAVARGIRYPEECEGDPGTSYVGDPDRVRQILVNLLSNAVKFTSPGGQVALSCGLATHGDPGARLVGSGPWTYLRVTDTGIGIPAEQLVRIFEPFVQAKAGYTRSEGGTGLGLAISRRLARLMAGDITVQSEVGKGSTFTLWLRGATADAHPTTAEYPALPPSVDAVDSTAVRELTTKVMREIEPIAERYVYRLRTETGVPDLSNVSQPYIKDHAETLIAEIATATSFLAETKGRASDLLRDGAEIQRLLAELHGAQRCKLGWTEAEIRRDVDTLREELERSTRALGGDPAATDFMVEVARKILDQWKQTSVRGYRFERAAGKR